jgi:hypothetical protein
MKMKDMAGIVFQATEVTVWFPLTVMHVAIL